MVISQTHMQARMRTDACAPKRTRAHTDGHMHARRNTPSTEGRTLPPPASNRFIATLRTRTEPCASLRPCSQPSEPHPTPNMTRRFGPPSELHPHSNMTQRLETLGALRPILLAPKHFRSLGANPPPPPPLTLRSTAPLRSPLPPAPLFAARVPSEPPRDTLTRGAVPSEL